MARWLVALILHLRRCLRVLVVAGERVGDAAWRVFCLLCFFSNGVADGYGAAVVSAAVFSNLLGVEDVSFVGFPFCDWGRINGIPSAALVFRGAEVLGARGLLFRSTASSPAAADFLSSFIFLARTADARSTSTIRLDGGSGRWILRLFQCLAPCKKVEGGFARIQAGGYGRPVFRRRRPLDGSVEVLVIFMLSRVFFVKAWGWICMLTVSSI